MKEELLKQIAEKQKKRDELISELFKQEEIDTGVDKQINKIDKDLTKLISKLKNTK